MCGRALWVLAALVLVLAPGLVQARQKNTGPDASQVFLRAVKQQLARSHSRVAHNTLTAIHEGRVHVLTMDHLSIPDCHALLHEQQWRAVAARENCVATPDGYARAPKEILADLVGYQRGNRIYMRVDPDVENAASTLLHEVNHVANHADSHYGSARQVFISEYRAYWVEHAARLGHAPDHAECVTLKHWIIDAYGLKNVSASDVTDLPPGNLTNTFATPPSARS